MFSEIDLVVNKVVEKEADRNIIIFLKIINYNL